MKANRIHARQGDPPHRRHRKVLMTKLDTVIESGVAALFAAFAAYTGIGAVVSNDEAWIRLAVIAVDVPILYYSTRLLVQLQRRTPPTTNANTTRDEKSALGDINGDVT